MSAPKHPQPVALRRIQCVRRLEGGEVVLVHKGRELPGAESAPLASGGAATKKSDGSRSRPVRGVRPRVGEDEAFLGLADRALEQPALL